MKTYSTLGYMTKENGTDFIIALQPIMSMRDKEDLAPSELELYEKHKSPLAKILHKKLNRFLPNHYYDYENKKIVKVNSQKRKLYLAAKLIKADSVFLYIPETGQF